jgi:hypothetical protein
MLPRDQDYARARRRIETAVGRPELTADGIVETVLEEAADVLGVTSACWHKTDPAAGALVDGTQLGGAPGSLEESLVYEFRRPDVNASPSWRARATRWRRSRPRVITGRPPARASGR